MAYTSWPTGNDLQRYMVAARLLSNPPDDEEALLDLQGFIDSAKAELEEKTGWMPFLDSGSDATWRFDLDGTGYIFFGGGLLVFTSLTVYGSACTNNVEFRLCPVNAPRKGKPYEYLEWLDPSFDSSGWSTANGAAAVAIAGRWGRVSSAAMPADVFQAALAKAANLALPGKAAPTTADDVVEVRQDDVAYKVDSARLPRMTAADRDAYFEATVKRYRRY